jgi:starch phosphorylase
MRAFFALIFSRKAILNVARMAKLSSDRTIGEYPNNIWDVKCRVKS